MVHPVMGPSPTDGPATALTVAAVSAQAGVGAGSEDRRRRRRVAAAAGRIGGKNRRRRRLLKVRDSESPPAQIRASTPRRRLAGGRRRYHLTFSRFYCAFALCHTTGPLASTPRRRVAGDRRDELRRLRPGCRRRRLHKGVRKPAREGLSIRPGPGWTGSIRIALESTAACLLPLAPLTGSRAVARRQARAGHGDHDRIRCETRDSDTQHGRTRTPGLGPRNTRLTGGRSPPPRSIP
jgi:hypothetical protein